MKLDFSRIKAFFATVPGAVKDHLNTRELIRIIVAAIGAGGGVFGVLSAILADTATLFPAPSDAAFAAVVLTTILEAYRRLGHGVDPTVKSFYGRPRA